MTYVQVFCTGPKSENNFKTNDISLKSFLFRIMIIIIFFIILIMIIIVL